MRDQIQSRDVTQRSTWPGQTAGNGDEGDRAQIFVAVLGASNYTFSCATSHQRLEDWTGSIVRAFEFFDGVTQLVVPDNARAMIADLANRYGTVVLPATPLRPRDKGEVEVAVQVVERWILDRLPHHAHRLTLKGESLRRAPKESKINTGPPNRDRLSYHPHRVLTPHRNRSR
jgi:transposase